MTTVSTSVARGKIRRCNVYRSRSELTPMQGRIFITLLQRSTRAVFMDTGR